MEKIKELFENIEKYRSKIHKNVRDISKYEDKIKKCRREISEAKDDIEVDRFFILDRLINRGFKKVDLVGEGGVVEVYLFKPFVDIEILNEDTYYEFFTELKEGEDYFILIRGVCYNGI